MKDILCKSNKWFVGKLFTRGDKEELLCPVCFSTRVDKYCLRYTQHSDDHFDKYRCYPMHFPLENNDCIHCVVHICHKYYKMHHAQRVSSLYNVLESMGNEPEYVCDEYNLAFYDEFDDAKLDKLYEKMDDYVISRNQRKRN